MHTSASRGTFATGSDGCRFGNVPCIALLWPSGLLRSNQMRRHNFLAVAGPRYVVIHQIAPWRCAVWSGMLTVRVVVAPSTAGEMAVHLRVLVGMTGVGISNVLSFQR